MVKRRAALLIICILGVSIGFQFRINDNAIKQNEPLLVKDHQVSYVSHEPFNITSNEDFETQGWPGNGSLSNPYLIVNLNITSNKSTCIWIKNTTSHFIIKDCLFSSPVYDYADGYLVFPITLANVCNARIVDNYVLNVSGGISGYRLLNCTISNNHFNATNVVLDVRMSNFTTIHNNNQDFDPCEYGLILVGCRHSTVSLNSFRIVRSIGISSVLAYNVSFVDNTILAFETDTVLPLNGIELWGGENCTIQGNEIVDFWWSGIELRGKDHIVEFNNITSNQRGIVVSTNGSVVRNNTLTDNSGSIEIVNSNNTEVYSNEMLGRSYYSWGITVYGGFDCDIYLNQIEKVGYGITLQGATGFNISNNRVSDGRYGFAFNWYGISYPSHVTDGPSVDCDIINNTFDRGGVFSVIDNYDSWNFSSIRFLGNSVNGRLIGFYASLDDVQINGEDYGQLFLINCTSTRIVGGTFYGVCSDVEDGYYLDPGQAAAITLVNCRNCYLEDIFLHNNTIGVNFQYSSYCNLWGGSCEYNSWAGALLWHSHNCYIMDVYFRGNLKGFALGWSWSCDVSDCLIWENNEAIDFVNSPSCSISRNRILDNNDAIFLADSDGCEVLSNTIYWNSRGILLNSSSDCLISENDIYNNTGVGISLDSTSHRNEIYDNVFAYNQPNAICEGSSNHWDNQVDTGNWWSDYIGIGVYVIDEDDIDNYPINAITVTPTETTTPATTIEPWVVDPLTLVIACGVVGLVLIWIMIIDRRRVVIID
jgi:parallel beta-helix repeat protein